MPFLRRFGLTVASTPTSFSSAMQCLLECPREGLVGCDQLLAFGCRVDRGNRRIGLTVVVALQSTCAHIVYELQY